MEDASVDHGIHRFPDQKANQKPQRSSHSRPPQLDTGRAVRKLTEIARQAGYFVSIKVYPGAHHSFDSNLPVQYEPARINNNSPTGRGATTGGDPKPWDDSVREVIAFFGQHLKKPVK